MKDQNGVDCETKLPRTANRQKKRLKTDSSSSTKSPDDTELMQCVDNIRRTIMALLDAQFTQELLGLQNQEFDLEMKLLDTLDNGKKLIQKTW